MKKHFNFCSGSNIANSDVLFVLYDELLKYGVSRSRSRAFGVSHFLYFHSFKSGEFRNFLDESCQKHFPLKGCFVERL